MPWRLVLFLIALTFVVFFAGFNLGNFSDISFGFHTFTGIPVFISLFIAFLSGTLVMLPFAVRRRRKRPVETSVSTHAIGDEVVIPGKAGIGRKPKRGKHASHVPDLPIDDTDDSTI